MLDDPNTNEIQPVQGDAPSGSVDPRSVEGLFLSALRLDAADRAKFLDEVCGDSVDRRQRLEALLRAYTDAGSFLESPVATFNSAGDEPRIDFLTPSEDPELMGTLGPYEVIELIGHGGTRRWQPHSVVEGQISLGDHGNPFGIERFHGQIGIVDHQRDSGVSVRTDDQRISLDDVDLGLQERGTDLQERLRAVWQFNPDQVRLDHRQTRTLQDLTPLLGVTEQESNKRTLRGIVNRQSHDANPTAFETAYDLEQLADTVLQEHGELADRGVISPTNRCEIEASAFANAHSLDFRRDREASRSNAANYKETQEFGQLTHLHRRVSVCRLRIESCLIKPKNRPARRVCYQPPSR